MMFLSLPHYEVAYQENYSCRNILRVIYIRKFVRRYAVRVFHYLHAVLMSHCEEIVKVCFSVKFIAAIKSTHSPFPRGNWVYFSSAWFSSNITVILQVDSQKCFRRMSCVIQQHMLPQFTSTLVRWCEFAFSNIAKSLKLFIYPLYLRFVKVCCV